MVDFVPDKKKKKNNNISQKKDDKFLNEIVDLKLNKSHACYENRFSVSMECQMVLIPAHLYFHKKNSKPDFSKVMLMHK